MRVLPLDSFEAVEVRVRGRVQGVGLRPALWRSANELGLIGEVFNDSEGVLLRIGGDPSRVAAFLGDIERKLPPLARIDSLETRNYTGPLPAEFRITASSRSTPRTEVASDAAAMLGRRAFLRIVGTGATAIVTVPMGAEAPSNDETTKAQHGPRYRETSHVKTFYRVNRYPLK